MSTTTQPVGFQFSLTPASVRLGTGITHYAGHVTVIDTGSVAISVHMSVWKLTHCSTLSGTPTWLHVPSGAFALLPGASKTVPWTVAAAPGTNGTAAVLATAAPLHARGHGTEDGKLSGAVGSRVTVGNGTTTCHAAALPAAPASGGFPVAGLGVAGGVLVLAGLVVAVQTARRRRRSRAAI